MRFQGRCKHCQDAIRMAILNRFSTTLHCCDSTHFCCFSLRNFWRFQARDSGNRAIRDSRFCAAKEEFIKVLALRNRSDFCTRFPRQDKEMLHCDIRVRWKVASNLQFRAAVAAPETLSLYICRISGDLAPSTRNRQGLRLRDFGARAQSCSGLCPH